MFEYMDGIVNAVEELLTAAEKEESTSFLFYFENGHGVSIITRWCVWPCIECYFIEIIVIALLNYECVVY